MMSLDQKIIGQSKPAVELKKMIGLIASSASPVIINGPTGFRERISCRGDP